MIYFDFPRKWFAVTGMPGLIKVGFLSEAIVQEKTF